MAVLRHYCLLCSRIGKLRWAAVDAAARMVNVPEASMVAYDREPASSPSKHFQCIPHFSAAAVVIAIPENGTIWEQDSSPSEIAGLSGKHRGSGVRRRMNWHGGHV